MPISSIQITGLFGYFNHDIHLNKSDRITIIHGANGVGKTTILRLLNDLFTLKLHEIRRIPFKKLIVKYSPTEALTIIKKQTKNKRGISDILLTYEYGRGKKEKYEIGQAGRRILHKEFPFSIITRVVPHLDRVGSEEWRDLRTREILSLEDVIYEYGEMLPEEVHIQKTGIPDKIKKVLEATNVYLIETQRLFTKLLPVNYEPHRSRYELRERMTVEQYSEDMISKVQQRIRESGSLSTSLDRDFPRRLLEKSLPEDATEDKIRKLYADQTKYRDRLMQAGLMKPEEKVLLPSGQLGDIERKVLWIYLTDVDKKLQIFNDLLLKAELLMDIINSRFSYKSFRIEAEDGFIFNSDHDQSNVPLRSLSSGEQHELVLAYDLLFTVKRNTLVMIDEPELSLHVSWQRKFLDDIIRIAELADLNFLIATHSPSIIHNRRDLMVGLGGKY